MKKTLFIICILTIIFVISCSKHDLTHHSWESHQKAQQKALLVQMLNSFQKTYPDNALNLDTSRAFAYVKKDSTTMLIVKMKTYMAEYGINADILNIPDSLREPYLKNSVWLMAYQDKDNDTMRATICSAIPTLKYLEEGAKKLPMIHMSNTQDFSGDLVLYTVTKKMIYHEKYEYGIPGAERKFLTIAIKSRIKSKAGGESSGDEEDPWVLEYCKNNNMNKNDILDDVDILAKINEKYGDLNNFCAANPQVCEIGDKYCEKCGENPCTCAPEGNSSDGEDTTPDETEKDKNQNPSGNNNNGVPTFPNSGNETLNSALSSLASIMNNQGVLGSSPSGTTQTKTLSLSKIRALKFYFEAFFTSILKK